MLSLSIQTSTCSLPFSLGDLVAGLSPKGTSLHMGVAKLPSELLYGRPIIPRCGGGGGRGDGTPEGTDRTDALVGRVSVGFLRCFVQLRVGD